ncbi:MAG: signal peptidase II [Alphaproteobacteria bacterium]|nr:signal peptidase II [Alphaproteobacteria bacterium]
MPETGNPEDRVRSAGAAADGTSPPARMFWSGLAVAAAVLLFDQLSKWAITGMVIDPACVTPPATQPGCAIPVLPFFNLTLVYNPGVTFGLGGGLGPLVLSGLAVAISVGLAVWLRKVDSMLLAIAIGGIIGGAIGNVVDRLRFGAVVDFLDVFIPGSTLPHWPAFNLADSAIVVGVGLIIVDGLIAGRAKTA